MLLGATPPGGRETSLGCVDYIIMVAVRALSCSHLKIDGLYASDAGGAHLTRPIVVPDSYGGR